MKRSLAAVLFAALVLFAAPANADINTVTQAFSVTATGATPWLALTGQSSCAVTYTSVGGGSTATVQGAADGVPTPNTVTAIGTAGVITNPAANASFGGAAAPQALTGIRLNFTSVTSGTVAGSLACSAAAPGTVTTTPSGTQNVQLQTGSNIAGKVGIDQTTPGTTNGVTLKDGSGNPISATAGGLATVGLQSTTTDSFAGNTFSIGALSQNYAWSGSGWNAAIICPSQAAVNISTATTTQIVAASGSTKVYVCQYDLWLSGTTTPAFQWEQGTGGTCGTGTAVISGTYGNNAAAASGLHFNQPYSPGGNFRTNASQALCIVTTGTAPSVQGYISYVQY